MHQWGRRHRVRTPEPTTATRERIGPLLERHTRTAGLLTELASETV